MSNGSAPRSGSIPSPARYGFSDAVRAEEQLRAIGWWSDSGPSEEAGIAALSRAPDPDLALHSMDRLREALGDGWPELAAELGGNARFRGGLLGVLGTSTAFGDHLAANPHDWRRLKVLETESDRGVDDCTAEILAAVCGDEGTLTGSAAVSALRASYRGLLLEIAAKDLASAVEPEVEAFPFDQVAEALSDAAVAALRAALVVAVRVLEFPLTAGRIDGSAPGIGVWLGAAGIVALLGTAALAGRTR